MTDGHNDHIRGEVTGRWILAQSEDLSGHLGWSAWVVSTLSLESVKMEVRSLTQDLDEK